MYCLKSFNRTDSMVHSLDTTDLGNRKGAEALAGHKAFSGREGIKGKELYIVIGPTSFGLTPHFWKANYRDLGEIGEKAQNRAENPF